MHEWLAQDDDANCHSRESNPGLSSESPTLNRLLYQRCNHSATTFRVINAKKTLCLDWCTADCLQIGPDRQCVEESVDTITLDVLLPLIRSDRVVIKADVEGAERRAFSPATASAFFDRVRVPLVLMEWHFHRALHQDLDQRRLVDDWLQFFYSRNYSAHDKYERARLGPDWSKWTDDVYFMLQA